MKTLAVENHSVHELPERALWLAVTELALMDLRSNDDNLRSAALCSTSTLVLCVERYSNALTEFRKLGHKKAQLPRMRRFLAGAGSGAV